MYSLCYTSGPLLDTGTAKHCAFMYLQITDCIRHWVWKLAYLVTVLSQDKVGGLRQQGHPA